MNSAYKDISLLIVDDDPPVAASLRRLFQRSGFRVSVAGSGNQAIEMLAQVAPRVVVSDYRMPDISGIDVLMEVQRRTPDAICVLISGYADSGELQSSIKKLQKGHPFFFVAKPWDDDAFVQQVISAVSAQAQV
ncbi:MAG: response regulator [Deltaproteobacteria bacterium]|nr:response regulator [Deltaproteobacteria bacterium]